MAIRPEMLVKYGLSDEQLAFIREMGLEYLNMIVPLERMNPEDMAAETRRIARFGFTISDLSCLPLQKCPEIILQRREREEKMRQFQDMVRIAGDLRIPLVSIAWQPSGIFRSRHEVGEHTRGGMSTFTDLEEIRARPLSFEREFGKDEIWDGFAWFLERAIPVCEETGVRMALHPSDPPIESLGGVACLIQSTEDYLRALDLAGGSPALSVKMCMGCWLEKTSFGSIPDDIREFMRRGALTEVHFRNVSAPLPRFEETLLEDGYGDMFAILLELVRAGFDGFISVDHVFEGQPSMGGRLGAYSYSTGYMKGMLHAVERVVALEQKG